MFSPDQIERIEIVRGPRRRRAFRHECSPACPSVVFTGTDRITA